MEELKSTENEVRSEVNVSNTTMGVFEKLLELTKKYGFGRMFFGVIFFVFFSYMAYIAVNPGVIFDRYEKYVTELHSNSVDYRMESAPIIRSYLNQLARETGAERAYVSELHTNSVDYRMESAPIIRGYLNQLAKDTGAERAYILEFHNGKSNPTGLQWQFGDLTFINDGTDDISDEIQNVSLSRYNFANLVHERSYWAGGIDELISIDERFYNRMRLNGGIYYAFQMIYGSNMKEIGILGISFVKGDELPDRNTALSAVHKYASAISPYLDEGSVRKRQ